MLMLHLGSPRDQEARDELAAVLPDGEVGAPDSAGAFETVLDADGREQALTRVWDAVGIEDR